MPISALLLARPLHSLRFTLHSRFSRLKRATTFLLPADISGAVGNIYRRADSLHYNGAFKNIDTKPIRMPSQNAAILDNLLTGVLVVDAELQVHFANTAAKQLLPLSHRRLSGLARHLAGQPASDPLQVPRTVECAP